MADPINFCGANNVLNPAPGTEHVVRPLPTFSADSEHISCWKLNEEDRAHVARTGEVWAAVRREGRPPPILISGKPLMEAWDQDSGLPRLYYSDGTHVVEDARDFARLHHGKQTYGDSDLPHTYHCAQVVSVLRSFGADWVYLAAGWLHDTEEDCWEDETIEQRRARVLERFGQTIEDFVWACTGVMFIDGVKQNRKARNQQQYDKIAALPAAAPVKGADRTANMEECVRTEAPIGFMYVDEVLEFDDNVGVHCPPAMRLRYLNAAFAIYRYDQKGKIKTAQESVLERIRAVEALIPDLPIPYEE